MGFQRLETEELVIRLFSNKDASAIFRLSQEKSLGEWIPDQVYENEEKAAEVIEFLKSQYEPSPDPRTRPFVLGIVLRATGEIIGHVGLSPLTDSQVEIGYAIGEAYQGKGFATQAVAAVSKWAVMNCDLEKINGIVACENIGSGRVLEKAGFTLESELDYNYLGKIRPCRIFSFTY